MQRLAILEYLEGTKSHPTADEVYAAVHKPCPTIARATVYNTLEALTKAGTILQLTVDPAAARYDADTGPHVHFRCRICGRVYDIDAKEERCLSDEVEGHRVESVRTYAFGVCSSCREDAPTAGPERTKTERNGAAPSRSRKRKAEASPNEPPAIVAQENDLKGRSHKASGSTRGRRTHNAP